VGTRRQSIGLRATHSLKRPVDLGQLLLNPLSLGGRESPDLHVKNCISCEGTQIERFLHRVPQCISVACHVGTDLGEFAESIQHHDVRREDLATLTQNPSIVSHAARPHSDRRCAGGGAVARRERVEESVPCCRTTIET
jgi:hypothetical protein